MKHLICSVIIVLMICSSVQAKTMVKCTGDLATKPTKDGFGRITLVCEDDIVINRDKPLYMYAKEGIIVFDQSNIVWPDDSIGYIISEDIKEQVEVKANEVPPTTGVTQMIRRSNNKIKK